MKSSSPWPNGQNYLSGYIMKGCDQRRCSTWELRGSEGEVRDTGHGTQKTLDSEGKGEMPRLTCAQPLVR